MCLHVSVFLLTDVMKISLKHYIFASALIGFHVLTSKTDPALYVSILLVLVY